MQNNTTVNLFTSLRRSWLYLAALVAIPYVLSGCSGLQVFGQIVAPGDTVAIAVNWQPDVSRADATIIIQDSVTTYNVPATDASVRGWINVYPDPVSRVVVGRETNQNLGVAASGWGIGVDASTSNDKDWFETLVFLDLPQTIAPGTATIDVQVSGVSILPQTMALNVLSQAAVPPHEFDTWEYGPLVPNQFAAMERADHYTVTFTGSQVPTAIQLELSHDPDSDNGGTGQAYVIPPRGDLKGVSWTDTGTTMKVLLTRVWHMSAEDKSRMFINDETLKWFKFYIAGGISGLQVTSVQAFDENGDVVPGILATIQ